MWNRPDGGAGRTTEKADLPGCGPRTGLMCKVMPTGRRNLISSWRSQLNPVKVNKLMYPVCSVIDCAEG